MRELVIIVEDEHAPTFVKKIAEEALNRLERKDVRIPKNLPRHKLCYDTFKTLLEYVKLNVIILVDGDLDNYKKRKSMLEDHIKKAREFAEDYAGVWQIKPVIFQNELEEWVVGAICDEKHVRDLSKEKASEILNRHLMKNRGIKKGYRKKTCQSLQKLL